MASLYLLAVLCSYLLASAVESSTVSDEQYKILQPKNVDRLRQMFKDSHDLALEGMYEAKLLDTLKNSSGKPIAQVANEDDDALINLQSTDHIVSDHKNDARQASLFSNLMGPALPSLSPPSFSGVSSNPFVSNILSTPQLPKLPTFTLPSPTPKPAKPPKSSIIGNNGGTTALTNDNVVVVNVLSNNY